MRRVLVLMAVVTCMLLLILGQALGTEMPAGSAAPAEAAPADTVPVDSSLADSNSADPALANPAPADSGQAEGESDAQSHGGTDDEPSQPDDSLSGQAVAVKTIYGFEIIETTADVDIIIRSDQPCRGSVRLDSPDSDTVKLVVSFEDSIIGFDPAGVDFECELISGLSANRRDDGTSEIALLIERFSGYSVLKGSEGETVIRLPKKERSVLYGKTIVIDPGHGSFPSQHPHGDPGADRSLDGEVIWEKDLNLAVALKLRDLLLELGANPVLTREEDIGLSLADRSRVADEAGGDVLISIHHNSSRVQWSQISGVEIYHKSGDGLSRALAQSLGQAMPQATGQRLAYVGVHRSFLLGVLEMPRIPSVLVEVGFMNCLDELKRLVTDDFQIKAATGLINGLVSYFSGESHEQLDTAGTELLARSWAGAPSGVDFLTQLTSNLPEVDFLEVELRGGDTY
ncbi:MAG: N-acetylmuramoyl-L-alanine amidase [Firmicutes bacterium]|nr:N-acetylmuramoyl-L-alanine amidase [Bacillota bacterium]